MGNVQPMSAFNRWSTLGCSGPLFQATWLSRAVMGEALLGVKAWVFHRSAIWMETTGMRIPSAVDAEPSGGSRAGRKQLRGRISHGIFCTCVPGAFTPGWAARLYTSTFEAQNTGTFRYFEA